MGGGGGIDDGSGKKGGPTEVFIGYGFSGEAWVVRAGGKIPLTTTNEGKIKFQDGDLLVTGNGFIWDVEGDCRPEGKGMESAWLELFPQSEARLSILDFEKKEGGGKVLGQLITRIELVRGLFWLQMASAGPVEKKLLLSNCPPVEFKPDHGDFGRVKEVEAFIGIENGALIVFGTHCRLVHKGLGIEARPDSVGNGKITATAGALYLTNLVEDKDMRASLAYRLHKYLVSGSLKSGKGDADGSEIYSLPPFTVPGEGDRVVERQATHSAPDMDALLDNHRNKLRTAEDGLVERRLAREKAFREEYDDAPDYLKQKAHREIKEGQGPEEVCRGLAGLEKRICEDYVGMVMQNRAEYLEFSRLEKQLGEKLLADENALIEAGRKGITATTKKTSISGKLTYHEVEFEFSAAERGIGMGMNKSKMGKEYLMLKLRYANKSKKQTFLCPDEEFCLVRNGERIPLNNYKLETNMDPGYSGEGHLLFVVPENAGGFTLQVGKKLEGKQSFDFNA